MAARSVSEHESVMRADPLERIITALQNAGCRPKQARDGEWRAHSPLREDRQPSLVITEKGDRVLVHDFGGGRVREVLESLGLAMADLFLSSGARPTRSSARGRRIAVYPYENSAGELLAAKSRFEPKGFRWRRPSDETRRRWREASRQLRGWSDVVADIGRARPGAWISGREGIDVTIYRLPDLVDHRRVVVANGEKAADLLWSLGIAATCGPSGEGQWSDVYTDILWRGGAVEVIVIPDNDKVGRQHGLCVARSCHRYQPVSPAALRATWPDAESDDPDVATLRAKVLMLDGLPHHGDVVDWLDAGHDASELRRLMDAAPDLDAVEQAHQDRQRELNRRRQQRFRDRRRAARQTASRSAA